MKKLTGLTFLIALALFNSCGSSEDGPPGPKTIFKFTFDTSYKTSSTDNWVILYDKTGKLIDFKAGESGETLSFESASDIPDDKLTVTILTHSSSASTLGFELESYLDIATGSEWTKYTLPDITLPSSTGTFKAKVTNVPFFFGASTSDRYGLTQAPGNMIGNAVNFEFVPIHSGEKQIMSFNDGSVGPLYRWIENPKDGDNYTFDYNTDFKAFDKTLTVSLPGPRRTFISSVTGYEATPELDKGYCLSFIVNLPPTSNAQIKLGFLNQFTNYDVYLSYGDFEFASFGVVPSRIDYVDPSKFTVTNKTITGFAFSNSTDYTSRYAVFGLEQSGLIITSGYYGPKGTTSTHPSSLPVELESKYPLLKFDKLEHIYTTFDIQGEDYQDRVKKGFTKPANSFSTRQTATVTVWN